MDRRGEAGGIGTARSRAGSGGMVLALAFLLSVLAVALAPPTPSLAAANPLVRVDDANLDRRDDRAVVTARIEWNRNGVETFGMTVGDVRLLAIAGKRNRPIELATSTFTDLASDPVKDVRFALDSRAELDAIRPGNRVVLTPSQHAPTPSKSLRTPRTYVTVEQLQRGRARGPVGQLDCSDRPIVAQADLEHCDLVGASLARAQVSTDVGGEGTRLLRADLTGADMREADLTRADIAGGRVNGADASGATIDRVSLAGADGIGFVARDTTFMGADIFDARMIDARFERSRFEVQTSLARSRFDRAKFTGAFLSGSDMLVARLVGADLEGATLEGVDLYFADLTKATLRNASLVGGPLEILLQWTLLCRTTLPDGQRVDRDCTDGRGPAPKPAGTPFVTVDANLRRGQGEATIEGRVRWSAEGMTTYGMTVGELRAVAVDARTGLPTLLGKATRTLSPDDPSERVDLEITGKGNLRALRSANRVVLTATQHRPRADLPGAAEERTTRSYVTVDQLQAGPNRGRVGSVACSDRPIGPEGGAGVLQFCDLVGADLARADLAGSVMQMADLSGADLRSAGLSSVVLDGGRAAGVPASGARLDDASLIAGKAPRLTVRSTLVSSANFFASSLGEASFQDSTLSKTAFPTAGLKGASFADTNLVSEDLSYARLNGADLSGARGKETALFLSDLTDATLRGASFGPDEEGRDPPRTATLCRTTMPSGQLSLRDCPLRARSGRSPNR